ncbi:MAG: UDP-2,3-diacylglucosamine diphosphatase [Steroidobacteraceae bacterium]
MTRGSYLFVSDLHLDASLPDAMALFLEFLRTEAARCNGLYILGDLFETWIGDDDDEPGRGSVCAALRELTGGGVPCFVQLGNRDFLLGPGFAARTGCTLLPDPLLLEIGHRRIAVSHGDLLCSADQPYQHFRALVRNPRVQRGFLALPLTTRRALAGAARAQSRVHTGQQREQIMDVAAETVAALLRAADADLLIHGHTHRPAIHRFELDGRARARIVLGDWYDQGSCLMLDAAGNYELRTLAARGKGRAAATPGFQPGFRASSPP